MSSNLVTCFVKTKRAFGMILRVELEDLLTLCVCVCVCVCVSVCACVRACMVSCVVMIDTHAELYTHNDLQTNSLRNFL